MSFKPYHYITTLLMACCRIDGQRPAPKIALELHGQPLTRLAGSTDCQGIIMKKMLITKFRKEEDFNVVIYQNKMLILIFIC
ncbi:MAG: hypothetical protein EOP53_26700 [Sphingobacteriales bacterium]|nr:MAG: hypothetical protein EOP53_26700 [Sphingobacteriales bacterium]